MPSRGASPYAEALAGGIAGGVSRLVIAPLDVVKIRLQLQRAPLASRAGGAAPPAYTGIRQTALRVLREEGLRQLWGGNGAAMALWVAYSAVQFPAYAALRGAIEGREGRSGGGGGGSGGGGRGDRGDDRRSGRSGGTDDAVAGLNARLDAPPSPPPHALTSLAAGGGAALLSTLATYPLDWARTLLASQGVPRAYAGTAAARAAAARSPAGARTAFQGLAPTLAQVVPGAAVTVRGAMGEGGNRGGGEACEGHRCGWCCDAVGLGWARASVALTGCMLAACSV